MTNASSVMLTGANGPAASRQRRHWLGMDSVQNTQQQAKPHMQGRPGRSGFLEVEDELRGRTCIHAVS